MARERVFRCVSCGNDTVHEIIASHTLTTFEEQLGWISIPFSLVLSKCKTCFEEGLYTWDEDDNAMLPLWPRNLDLGEDVPTEVKQLYVEASAVRRASPNAFAVLIRKALEAVCADQGAEGKNLDACLRSLTARLTLPATVEQIANAARLIGNMGAHFGKSAVSDNQAEALEEFFRGVIEYVYVAPARLRRYDDLLGKLPVEAGGPKSSST